MGKIPPNTIISTMQKGGRKAAFFVGEDGILPHADKTPADCGRHPLY